MQLHTHLALAADRPAELRREAQDRRLAREAQHVQRPEPRPAPTGLRALIARLHVA